MIDKCLKEEQVPGVDERLVRVVRIIVEQYDGDVRAFIESIRLRLHVMRRAEGPGQATGAGQRGGTFEH
jgi:hypothetical protein